MKILSTILLAAIIGLAGCSKDKQAETGHDAAADTAAALENVPPAGQTGAADQASEQVGQQPRDPQGSGQTTPPPPAPREERVEREERAPARDRTEDRPTETTRLVTLPAGYALQAVLDETVSTDTHQPGRAFSAHLARPAMMEAGGVVFPEGSKVRGEVTNAKSAPRVGGRAELTLEFREVTTPAGKSYPLHTQPLTLQGESTTSGDVQKVVGGTVGGAIIGGILGGKEGAIKGAAGGAAGGAAWAVATRGNDIVLEPGQVLQATLTRDLRVSVTTRSGDNP